MVGYGCSYWSAATDRSQMQHAALIPVMGRTHPGKGEHTKKISWSASKSYKKLSAIDSKTSPTVGPITSVFGLAVENPIQTDNNNNNNNHKKTATTTKTTTTYGSNFTNPRQPLWQRSTTAGRFGAFNTISRPTRFSLMPVQVAQFCDRNGWTGSALFPSARLLAARTLARSLARLLASASK